MIDRVRRIVAIAATVSLALPGVLRAEGEHHHWTYGGATGPAKWVTLEPEFTACGLGKMQSPIDIRDADAKKSDLPAIAFDYKPSPLKIIDNGHTVQVNYAPGSFITVQGKQYELQQFHFHKPSEEKINGKAHAMVAHLVHKNAEGNLAVVAVLLDEGGANPTIATVWKHLPKEKEKEISVKTTVDAARLLPGDKGYYTFQGSLTTPPCSEGVRWFVLKTPVKIADSEIAAFGELYPMNARPTQSRNGRAIEATR